MDKALAALIRISNATGNDATLVQGGGGNTSVKTDDGKYMFIKASGTALKDMDEKNGWRRLRLDLVRSIIDDPQVTCLPTQRREVEVVNRLLLTCDDDIEVEARPSVEAHLHAFLDSYVIHLHPNAVGAYVCAKNGRALLEKLFEDEKYPPLWVGYTDPGYMLAKRIAKLVANYQQRFGQKPAILFLEKHGLFVTAPSANSALTLVRKVIKRCNSMLKQPTAGKLKPADNQLVNDIKLCFRRAFFNATGCYMPVTYFYDQEIAAFLGQKNARKLLASSTLTPDELVYANGTAVWVEKCDAEKIEKHLVRQINRAEKPSAAFLVRGVGLFAVSEKKVARVVRDITATSFFVRSNAAGMGGIASLNKRQQQFINEWESEAFRKKLASGTGEGQLRGRIALVTGAGSGLGRSIAIGLAGAGAYVAVADIDAKAAQQTARLIEQQLPHASAMTLVCDVTNQDSTDEAFQGLLDNWGGLDLLVNAAGVAAAYRLTETPLDKWQFTVDVNLTGYFLMARAAARVMIKQAIGGSIINISSKSGLDASRDNSAYNATKAGQLHMARGWALELGEHGIRVNSVCPGNVFKGSKIWNARYIKACAEKYGIKPEEVIPFYINKTCLKQEITGQDIADSVIFLASDRARTITGQTIVADSGQVMVR